MLVAILAKVVLGIDIFKAMEGVLYRFVGINSRSLSMIIYWILAQVVFYLYDYAMTLIITFYMERIHNKIK